MSLVLSAQTVRDVHQFGYLGIEDGLSQGYVSRILQDKFGYMWFATLDGLNRYDGKNFKVYYHDQNNPLSIPTNSVLFIQEVGDNGDLWVQNQFGELSFYSRELDGFIAFDKNSRWKVPTEIGRVFWVCEDKPGGYWVLSSTGWYHFDITIDLSVGERVNSPQEFLNQGVDVTVQSFLFSSKIIDSASSPRITMGGGGQYVMHTLGRNYVFSPEKLPDFKEVQTPVPGILLCDSTGFHTLIGNERIYALDKDLQVKSSVPLDTTLNFNFKFGVFQIFNGKIWFLHNNFCWSLDESNLHYERWYFTQDMLTERENNYHVTLYIDRSGLMWIGSNGNGILQYNPRKAMFENIYLREFVASAAHYPMEASDGTLYCHFNGKMKRVDLNTGIIDSDSEWLKIGPQVSEAKQLLEDIDGSLWARHPTILYHINAKTKAIKAYSYVNGRAIRGEIKPFYLDEYNRLWLGTQYGACLYDRAADDFIPIDEHPESLEKQGLSIEALYADKDYLWMGTNKGLYRYNIANRMLKMYMSTPGNPKAMGSAYILSFCPDPIHPEQRLWMGSQGGGLMCLHKETDEFQNFTTREGLSNDVIYGILPDNEGKLWLSSNRGLMRFDPSSVTVLSYAVHDGMRSYEYNRLSYCKLKSGKLVFGGMKGLTLFDPRNIHPLNMTAPLVITGLFINNHPYTLSKECWWIPGRIHPDRTIVLDETENNIHLEFAGLDFNSPERIQYKYMLEGIDPNWVESGTLNEVTYAHLAPGYYSFKVLCTNSDGVWNTEPMVVRFRIMPPFYQSWWFRILVIFGVLIALYFLNVMRVEKVKREQRYTLELARMLGSEMDESLTSIEVYSQTLKSEIESQSDIVRNLLTRIGVHAKLVGAKLHDGLWAIQPTNNSLGALYSAMRGYSEEELGSKGISLNYHFEVGTEKVVCDMRPRTQLYFVFKEVVKNVSKHSQAEEFSVSAYVANKQLYLEIEDNGKGFDPAEKKEGKGLAFIQETIGQLSGQFQLESIPERGTRISIQVPLSSIK